ncbi:MAG TPA: hypothetical protein VL068_11750 [Microthrixaceae bacterium]|nr:hypothetical protein [Microthrixaceae bacterium]
MMNRPSKAAHGQVFVEPASLGRRSRVHGAGQSGSVLLFVLAIVLVLTIAIGALLRATSSTGMVAHNLEVSSAEKQKIDGQMERMVNILRNAETITQTEPCPALTIPAEVDGISVDCYGRENVTAPTLGRKYNIQAEKDGQVVGQARIFVTDQVNLEDSVGYSLTVCDWLIGTALVNNQTLIGCPGD